MDIEKKKKLAKFAFGLVTSILIGQLIKLERRIEENLDKRIDDHFDQTETS